jgi:ABC-type transporter Mla MlaB component
MMTASAPQSIAFAIWGPITRDDLPGLTDRVCGLLRGSGATTALCDVTGVELDAVTVDALARFQLAAGRLGCTVRLRNASPALRELVALMGLRDVLTD